MIDEILPAEVVSAEAFDDAVGAYLFPEEQAVIVNAVEARRREFGTVRRCAREALASLGYPPAPLLPGQERAPQWPAGIVGSMTHCTDYRAAVADARRAKALAAVTGGGGRGRAGRGRRLPGTGEFAIIAVTAAAAVGVLDGGDGAGAGMASAADRHGDGAGAGMASAADRHGDGAGAGMASAADRHDDGAGAGMASAADGYDDGAVAVAEAGTRARAGGEYCDYRAAAVARGSVVRTIGIDAEPNLPLPDGVLDLVSLPEERRALADLSRAGSFCPDREAPGGGERVHWDRLLFSCKETIYKAWYPLARRWLGFEDALVRIDPAAAAFTARILVPGPVIDGVELRGFRGRWLARDGLLVTAIAVLAELPGWLGYRAGWVTGLAELPGWLSYRAG
jgi:4'-phosphopantetheinyl transferase EntD